MFSSTGIPPTAITRKDLVTSNLYVNKSLTVGGSVIPGSSATILGVGVSSKSTRYIATTGTYTIGTNDFLWGVLLNTGASTIQFPSYSKIQAAIGYFNTSVTKTYTYRIVNDSGSSCTVTAGTGGTVPTTITIPANAFAQILIVLIPGSYSLYDLSVGAAGGSVVAPPTGLWHDLVTSANIPNPSFFLYRDPGILTPIISSNVSHPMIKCVDDSTSTKLFFVAWFDQTQLLIFGMAFTYNITTAAFSYGPQTQLDTYIDYGTPNARNYIFGITKVDASHVIITYVSNYSTDGSGPVYVNYVTFSGTTITVNTPTYVDNANIKIAGSTNQAMNSLTPKLLTGTTYLYMYNSATAEQFYAVVINVSGSTLSLSSLFEISSSVILIDFVVLSPTTFVFNAGPTSIGTSLYICYGTMSGTFPSYTVGTLSYSGAATASVNLQINYGSVIMLSSSLFVSYVANVSYTTVISPSLLLYSLSGTTWTLHQNTTGSDYYITPRVLSSTQFVTYSYFAAAQPMEMRLLTISGGTSITLTTSLALTYTPGGAVDVSMDILDSSTRYIVCNSLSTDFITLSGGTVPLINMTNTKPIDLVPYGGGTPVPIVSDNTMSVELLPSSVYFSHTRLGLINDNSSSTAGVIGDAVNEIGTTDITGKILTFT